VFPDVTEQMFGWALFKKWNAAQLPHQMVAVYGPQSGKYFDIDTGEIMVREKQLTGREHLCRIDSELRPQEAFAFFANEVDTANPKAPLAT